MRLSSNVLRPTRIGEGWCNQSKTVLYCNPLIVGSLQVAEGEPRGGGTSQISATPLALSCLHQTDVTR
jgi:hypothetical protein